MTQTAIERIRDALKKLGEAENLTQLFIAAKAYQFASDPVFMKEVIKKIDDQDEEIDRLIREIEQ